MRAREKNRDNEYLGSGENKSALELKKVDEINSSAPEIFPGKEENEDFGAPPTGGKPGGKPVEKDHKKSRLSKPMLGMVAAVTAVVVAVTALPSKPPNVTATEQVGGNYIAYEVSIENTDKIELTLSIYNDYYKKEEKVIDGVIKGVAEGLKANTEYYLKVNGSQGFGDKTFFIKKIKTEKKASVFLPKITVEYYNKTGEIGLFYKISIEDFLNYYSNYKIFVTFGENKEEMKYRGEITDEQCLRFNLSGEHSLIITADTIAPSDIEKGITNKTVYSSIIANTQTDDKPMYQ